MRAQVIQIIGDQHSNSCSISCGSRFNSVSLYALALILLFCPPIGSFTPTKALECHECFIISPPGKTCEPLPQYYLDKVATEDYNRIRFSPGNYTKLCQKFQLEGVTIPISTGQWRGQDGGLRHVNLEVRLGQMWEAFWVTRYEKQCLKEPAPLYARHVPVFKDLLPNATFSNNGDYTLCSCRDKDFCNKAPLKISTFLPILFSLFLVSVI